MRLEQLTLTNFKRHAQLELIFAPGLNLLVGPNYAGKSSALQAVLMALFGVTCVPGGLSVAVRDGAKSGSLRVGCRFKHLKNSYTLERTHKGATLLEDETTIARGHTAVNERIVELLGQDGKTFQRLHTLRQGEAAELLGLSGTELTALVERLLGLDLIDRVLRRGRDKVQFLQGQLEGLERPTPEMMAELTDQWEAQRREVGVLQAQWEAASQKENALSQAFETADRDCKAAMAQQLDFQRYTSEKASLEVERKRLLDRLEVIQDSQKDFESTDLKALTQALESCRRQWLENESAQREAKALEQELEHLRRLGSEAYKAYQAMELPPPPAAQLLEVAQAGLEQASSTHIEALQRFQAARYAYKHGICQACKRPFEGEETMAVLEEKFEKARAEETVAGQRLEQARTRVQELERIQVQSHQSRLDKGRLRERLNECNERWATLKARYREIPERLDFKQRKALQVKIESLEQQSQTLTRFQAESRVLTERFEQVDTQLKALTPVEPIDTEPLEQEVSMLSAQLGEAREARHAAHLALSAATSQADQLQSQLERYRSAQAKAGKIGEQLDTFQQLLKLLRTHREQFLDTAWQKIYALAGQFVAQVTGGDVSAIEPRKQGLVYIENDRPRPLSAASGAQRDLLGLALKLALSNCLGGSSCLLLDEPTGAMENDLAVSLMLALRAENRQVLAVTHRLYDTTVADAAFEFTREN